VRRSVLLAIALAALGCASASAPERARESDAIHDFAMRARVERLVVGQSEQAARAILGRDAVQRPGHPEDPYPSPRRALSLATPGGEELRLELYVVAARRAEGCPDVHVEDAPVAFRGGTVAALGWEEVEASWRAWGGSLDALRDVRDTYQCEYRLPAVEEP
jgi:hypothetical protein